MSRFNIPLEKLVVIHDDIDMEIGKLRIRRKGSSGGHKGIESVIQSISSKDFVRLKIGIGRDNDFAPEDYVLSRFRRDEISLMKKAIEKASEAATLILAEGIEKAMNIFNTN
jgi:PTH1 family peptidyl-tRNA hydrolase